MLQIFFYFLFALLLVAYNYPLDKKRPTIQAQEFVENESPFSQHK